MLAFLSFHKLLSFQGRVGAFFGVTALTAAIPIIIGLILELVVLP
jgi:hypothetical protein